MKILRKILEIDEELCDGCGQCILDCAEHALKIVDGKVKVVSESLCDGLGACLQGCPQGALRIVEREALPFDEEAVHSLQKAQNDLKPPSPFNTMPMSCPSLNSQNPSPWPVKLRLVPPTAPFLSKASILLVADCVPAVHKDFASLRKGHVVLTVCPKFESSEAIHDKLTQIFANNTINNIHTVRMDVPCCKGLQILTENVLQNEKSPPQTRAVFSIIKP